MSDSLSALLGIVILIAIGLVAWRLARQMRRRSEDVYASEVPGVAGRNGNASAQPGTSVVEKTLFAQQHATTGTTWNAASHGGDGPS